MSSPSAIVAAVCASALLVLCVASCGRATEEYVTECIVPEDQGATFLGHWKATPLPIGIRASQFSEAEVGEVKAAIAAWNSFFSKAQSLEVLDSGGETLKSTSTDRPTSICAQGIVAGDKYSGQVTIYKQGTWPYASQKGVIAVTTTCPLASTGIPAFYMGAMELNFQHFWGSGQKKPDLRSILVHELGHLIGLDHSCNASTSKSNFVGCSQLGSANRDYYYSVLFPVIQFDSSGFGEQRHSLTRGDQGRANCLYGASSAIP